MIKVTRELIPYKFYNDEVLLQYDPLGHVYYYTDSDGNLECVDGVTTVVKIIDKSNILINWAVKLTADRILSSVVFPITDPKEFTKAVTDAKKAHRERLEDAGNVGTQAHNWIEGFIKKQLEHPSKDLLSHVDSIFEDERVNNCCAAAISWMINHNVRWRCTERKIYSRSLKYAGTLDGIAVVDSCSDPECCPVPFKDHLSLIDWKSSNQLYTEYLYQTAAYQYAYEEETGEEIKDRWLIRLGKEDGKFEAWHVQPEWYALDIETFRLCLDLTRSVKNVTNRVAEFKRERQTRVKMAKAKEREEN